MDYRLLYTQMALNDLAEIIGHIAEDDADAASRFGSSLLDHVDLLVRFVVSFRGQECPRHIG
ncbi:MAG TPA: type II toxin-antitoxin system RelE/ParE family toxin [Candidatus Sulfotelmatobacter sp.]